MINESPHSVKTAYTFGCNYFNSDCSSVRSLMKFKPKFLHFLKNSGKRLVREKNKYLKFMSAKG